MLNSNHPHRKKGTKPLSLHDGKASYASSTSKKYIRAYLFDSLQKLDWIKSKILSQLRLISGNARCRIFAAGRATVAPIIICPMLIGTSAKAQA
jgi:hypothetical protein